MTQPSEFLISARALRLALREKITEDIEWPEGELPLRGPCYLVADGLASRSLPDPKARTPYTPWLTILKKELKHQEFGKLARGFSYYKARFHYGRSHTDITIDLTQDWATSRTSSYIPRNEEVVTYIAFSLAGLIFTLGIGSFMGREVVEHDLIREVILVQPAFRPTEEAIEALQGVAVPNAVAGLITLKDSLAEQITTALNTVTHSKRSTKIKMLYWEDDEFIDYSPSFRASLEEAGVICIPLKLVFSDDLRPFERHSAVAQHPDFFRELEKHL